MQMTLAQPRPLQLPKILRVNLKSFVAALLMGVMSFVAIGCSTESTKQVCQDIANALPTVMADANIAAEIAETLDPAVAPIIAGVAASVDAGLVQIQAFLTTYANSQDATTLGSIQSTLVSVMNTNATALLNAAHITDPVSRAAALKYLGLLQTGLQLLYSIYQKIQSKAQVKTTVAELNYKLSDIAPYLNHERVEQATGVSFDTAMAFEQSKGF